MNNKILWTILVLFIFLLGGVYLYNQKKVEVYDSGRDQALEDALQRPDITLNTKHQYKDGQHTYVGTVEVPTPCHEVSTRFEKNENETVIYIETSTSSEVCAQVITEKEFRITFEGQPNDKVVARLNNELVNLNVFDLSPDQNIDEYQIENKG